MLSAAHLPYTRWLPRARGTTSLVAVPRASSQTRIAATAPRPAAVYLDLAQLLLQIDSATVGALDEQAVHDTLSDVWLRAEEQFILRVPKTTDTGHAAVLQGTMAQLTQLARNRGCELEWVEDFTITRPSHSGSDPIPDTSSSFDPGPTPDPSPFSDNVNPDEPPTLLSFICLLLTTSHFHCFHLHLPPAARAAGKGLPTARRAVDQQREKASEPHSADLYAKPLQAEQVMQVLRQVQLQRGQEVQMRVYKRSIEELQSHPELEGLLEAKDLHMQAYCDSHVVVATHPLPNYRPQLDPIWSETISLWLQPSSLAAAQLDRPWPDPLFPGAPQLTAGVQPGDQQVPRCDRSLLYPGPSPATAARWGAVQRMLKGDTSHEMLGGPTEAPPGLARGNSARLMQSSERTGAIEPSGRTRGGATDPRRHSAFQNLPAGREERSTDSSLGNEDGEWWGNSAGEESEGGATARYGDSSDEDGATASLRDLGAYASLQQGRVHHLRAALAAKRQRQAKHDPGATNSWQRQQSILLEKQQAANQRLPHVQAIQVQRQALPIHASKQQLLEAIERNAVTIVSGETGSGKSTQLPQFLLEEAVAAGRGAAVSLVVTQPRRISTISLARRVAQERGEALGDVVGYKVRLDSCVSRNTRLTYITSGLLLRRLLIDPDLEDTTHVFIDEVHERHTNTDFTLIALKQLLARRPGFKIVLMSATLHAQLFATYFGSAASCFAFPGRTFPVQQYYLEDFLQESGITPFADDELREANIELSSLVRRLAEEEQLKQQAATPGQEGSSIPSLSDLYGWAGGEQQTQLEDQAPDDAMEEEWQGQQVEGQQVGKQQLEEGRQGNGRQAGQQRDQQKEQKGRAQQIKGQPDQEQWREEELQVESQDWHCGFDLGLAAKAHAREQRPLSRRVLLGLKAWLEQRDGKVDLFLAAAVVRHLHATQPPGGAILVLLPGWQDIEWLRALLTCGPDTWGQMFGSRQKQDGSNLDSGNYGDSWDAGGRSAQPLDSSAPPQAQGQISPQPVEGMWVLPCHSSLTREEQQRVFDTAPPGSRKVVLATNIAETSITIPDVTVVVDSGRSRQVGYDPLNKIESLTRGWISQSSAEQRKGRAGRVQPGVCYRLYPRLFWQHHMVAHGVPELQRIPLEEVCMQVLSLELGDPAAFLAEALDPPNALAVKNALALLHSIGAILPTRAFTGQQQGYEAGKQEPSAAADPASFSFTTVPSAWQLTQLGHALAALPLEPRLGKMLILGAAFGCLAPMLTLAAHSMGHPAWLRVPRWPALEEEVLETRRWGAMPTATTWLLMLGGRCGMDSKDEVPPSR
ncbi:P-loop containing nucleoside triphosphate hydrolase protein [Haematococcus lacustris]